MEARCGMVGGALPTNNVSATSGLSKWQHQLPMSAGGFLERSKIQMAVLPPFMRDTVVAIGIDRDKDERRWVGTGFLYGTPIPNHSEGSDTLYKVWLVTNKHVLRGLKQAYLKFNAADSGDSKDYRIALMAKNGRPLWIGHPDEDIDVAAMPLNASALKREKRRFSFFGSGAHTMNRSDMVAADVSEGEGLFVLGFPMGLVGESRQYATCRAGCLARVRDFLEDRSKDLLADIWVFPGNSGGPVVIQPSAYAITGTSRVQKADLIGIVKSYVSYRDVAMSQQTGRPRVIFEENSGLTAFESVDSIDETIALAEKRLKQRAAQARYRATKAQTTATAEELDP